MSRISSQIVPAQPGYYTIVDIEGTKELWRGEPVIAWRIETFQIKNSDDVFSQCIALTVDGDVVSNCIGVQNPDNTVTVFEDSTYESLEALQAIRYPES